MLHLTDIVETIHVQTGSLICTACWGKGCCGSKANRRGLIRKSALPQLVRRFLLLDYCLLPCDMGLMLKHCRRNLTDLMFLASASLAHELRWLLWHPAKCQFVHMHPLDARHRLEKSCLRALYLEQLAAYKCMKSRYNRHMLLLRTRWFIKVWTVTATETSQVWKFVLG